jgi:hypothetical protein
MTTAREAVCDKFFFVRNAREVKELSGSEMQGRRQREGLKYQGGERDDLICKFKVNTATESSSEMQMGKQCTRLDNGYQSVTVE